MLSDYIMDVLLDVYLASFLILGIFLDRFTNYFWIKDRKEEYQQEVDERSIVLYSRTFLQKKHRK